MGLRVRYYCHAGLPTGFGRCAFEYALALVRHTNVELDLRLIPSTSAPNLVELYGAQRGHELLPCVNAGGEPDVVLVHTLPKDCVKVLDIEGISASTPSVAYTTWETWRMPEDVACDLEGSFARILSPSLVSLRAMSQGTGDCSSSQDAAAGAPQGCKANYAVVPHTFDPDLPELAVARAKRKDRRAAFASRRGHPGGPSFDFLYVGAWNERKNVDGLVRAFAAAFPDPEAPARLLIHSPKTDRRRLVRAIASTGLPVADLMGRVLLQNHTTTNAGMFTDVHAISDCYVSASRGEAWNLGAFEAMLIGSHVIVPRGQGSDDFLGMTSAVDGLIECRLEPAFQDVTLRDMPDNVNVAAVVSGPQGLTCEQSWWEPRLADLVHEMRRVAADEQTSSIAIDYDVVSSFGHASVAKKLLHELEIAHG